MYVCWNAYFLNVKGHFLEEIDGSGGWMLSKAQNSYRNLWGIRQPFCENEYYHQKLSREGRRACKYPLPHLK
jgi:hypothetical protein